MTTMLLAVLGCGGSFAGGYYLRPRVTRTAADRELADLESASGLIRALRNDIAELPAAIYATDYR